MNVYVAFLLRPGPGVGWFRWELSAENRPWYLPGEFEVGHGRGGVLFASSLQIFDEQFLKQGKFPIAVQFAKFSEYFDDCTIARVRAQRAADVGATTRQFKHVICAGVRHAGADSLPIASGLRFDLRPGRTGEFTGLSKIAPREACTHAGFYTGVLKEYLS